MPVPYEPAAQVKQVPSAIAAVAVEYLPRPHRVQLAEEGEPMPVPYVPAAQFKQVATAVAPEAVE